MIHLPPDKLADFCQRWRIEEFALFGSVLREDFSPESDVDVLLTFAPDVAWSLFDQLRLEEELTHLIGRQVDVLTRQAVERSHNAPLRQAILDTAQVVYVS